MEVKIVEEGGRYAVKIFFGEGIDLCGDWLSTRHQAVKQCNTVFLRLKEYSFKKAAETLIDLEKHGPI